MSPVVIHFTSVFFVSAICLVPSHGPVFFAVLIGATAVLGVVVSIIITVWVVRTTMTQYVPDYFAYGAFPVLAYLAMLTAAIMILKGQDYAPEVLAGGCSSRHRQHPQCLGSHFVDGATPRRQTIVKLVELADLYLRRPSLSWTEPSRCRRPWRRHCTGLRGAFRRPWRSACGRSRWRSPGPVANKRFLPGDHGAGVRFARHIDRHIEIDFFAPGQDRGRERKCGDDGLGRGCVEQFGVELQRAEIEADARHAVSLLTLARHVHFPECGRVGKRGSGLPTHVEDYD